MILDPCTLFTSLAAIGYIDRELHNRHRILVTGCMFVGGKLVTYVLLSIPFLMGAQSEGLHHFMEHWGEPLLAVFMLLCGLFLLITGHHHHEHDHGMTRWLQSVDEKSSGFWAFMLGIFFAICFCPHRLIYLFTMIDLMLTLPLTYNWLLPVVFGLATGLPILLLAWAAGYTSLSRQVLEDKLHRFERIFRYCCATLFIGYGAYLILHLLLHHVH